MKIIARPGGGLWGIEQMAIEARLGILKADCHIGDSVGALNSAMRAVGKSPTYILNMMMVSAKDIFDHSTLDQIEDLNGLSAAKYRSGPLHDILSHELADVCFGDLDCLLYLSSWNLNTDSPYWFHNGQDDHVKLVDAVMASCACPTLFPSWPIAGLGNFADGGIPCHSPADKCVFLFGAENISALLNIGTGDSRVCIARTDALDWGQLTWLRKDLLEAFGRLRENESNINCRMSLGDRYRSINPPCESIAIDDVSKISRMRDIGNTADLADVPAWLAQKGWTTI